MSMPFNPMNRVLSLFKREADSLAAEAANAKLVVENVDGLIVREMEPDAAERQQLAGVEAAAKMLRERIAAREQKVETLREQRGAAEEERAELAAQAEAAAQVIENARVAARQQAQEQRSAPLTFPPLDGGSPVVTRHHGLMPGQQDGGQPS